MDKYLIEKKSGKPRHFRIARIEEYIELVTWISSTGNVIFRGQNRDLPLIPYVGRDKDKKHWFYNEKNIFDEFKREALPYLGFTPVNDWQWLSVAQHNRLPTRLLDWTRSPLAALWFAVCNPAVNGEPGIVWVFIYDPDMVISNTSNLPSPFEIDKTLLYFPEHVFPYIQAQSGVFTIHSRDEANNEFKSLESIPELNLQLSKIEFPADAFPILRYQLFRLGITPSILFPGIYGLIERIKYQNELCTDEAGEIKT